MRRLRYLIPLIFVVPVLAVAGPAYQRLKQLFADGLRNVANTKTFLIDSDTSAATATATVPAVTVTSTKYLDANDLVFAVNSPDGGNLFSVDLEGDLVAAGAFTFSPADISMSGGDLTSTHTTQSFNVVSDTNDATTSTSVPAIKLKASVNVTNGDLLLAVQNSAAGNAFTVDEQGLCTALTDVAAAGNDFQCTGTGATCGITSSAADGTTSSTVGAITLKAGADITAGDLVLDVQDSAANHLLSVTEAGAASVLTSLAVGGGTALLKITSEQVDNQDIGSAAGGACAVKAVSVAGATLGDSVICQSVQDDAAWDTGVLTCFVESSGVVKLTYCAGASGGDPAAGNDYRFTILRF